MWCVSARRWGVWCVVASVVFYVICVCACECKALGVWCVVFHVICTCERKALGMWYVVASVVFHVMRVRAQGVGVCGVL